MTVDLNKPNQDAYSITTDFAEQETDALFAVFDGHGAAGDKCAIFARDNITKAISKQVGLVKEQQLEGAETVNDIELNKAQVQDICSKSHVLVNKAMHSSNNFEDDLSGTTAISALFQGRRNRVTISNVGDSRAVLGKRVKQGTNDALTPFEDGAIYRAIPLSKDQTPYRKSERKRILETGARILSLDQIEGLAPVKDDEDDESDFELGEELDEGGDPPRVWHPTLDYPGTAFSRSLGDALAETLGVIPEPEMVTRELETGDEIIVLASDGVFEFLTNQSVIDICTKFKDPLEACKAVISEAYELWLQYELRTDDITMICIFVDGIDKNAAKASSTRASILDTQTDIPDNIMTDSIKGMKDEGKMNKRLTEMKIQLEEALLGGPNGKEVDLQKLHHEKTDDEKSILMHASQGSVMMQSMTKKQFDQVISVMQPVTVKKGEWIIQQGKEGDRFYIIEEGEFEARVISEGASESASTNGGLIVHKYQASKDKKIHPSFGELALLYAAPRAASVIALRDSKLWALDRSALKAIMLGDGRKELVDILRSIPELEKYKIEEIEEFASAMKEVSFKKGENIITANTCGNALYVISEGIAKIILPLSSKNDVPLSSTLERLDFFGQEVISPQIGEYLASVEAVSNVLCWKLDKGVTAHSMKKMKAVREGRSTV